MRHKPYGQKAKAARVRAARNPDKNLTTKEPTGNLNRQEEMTVTSVGAATPQAENNPGLNGTDKKRLISLCHWAQAQVKIGPDAAGACHEFQKP